jgi:hypothetical protein
MFGKRAPFEGETPKTDEQKRDLQTLADAMTDHYADHGLDIEIRYMRLSDPNAYHYFTDQDAYIAALQNHS